MLSSSRYCNILGNYLYFYMLMKIIVTPNIPKIILQTSLESLYRSAKFFPVKKRIICDKLIHLLSKIIISACSEETIKDYTKEARVIAIKFMLDLAAINSLSMYIPGETLDTKKMKRFVIS